MTDTVNGDQAAPDGIDRDDEQIDPSKGERMERLSEAWWASRAPEVAARRCKARRSDGSGDRCSKAAMKGQRVCGTHGGKARRSMEAAKRRIAESADPAAAQLVKLAFDKKESAEIRLRATLQLLDRAGLNAKTAVEITHDVKPFEQIIEGISDQLEITSRADYRRSVGDDVPDDDGETDPLAGLIADDVRQSEAHAQRVDLIGERIRANRFVHNDDVIDVSVVDVSDDGYPVTPGDHDRQRDDDTDGLVPLHPTRPGGPMDQPMTVEQGNELMAEIREREAQRRREQGHAVIRSAQRALPRGRS
ncbi:MAG: hypothetical protein JST91_26545 [Actinobacteria bacterium]|nr:hypothetical protein [Actinomycetota bacterium]